MTEGEIWEGERVGEKGEYYCKRKVGRSGNPAETMLPARALTYIRKVRK
jgi:hypothetical protein